MVCIISYVGEHLFFNAYFNMGQLNFFFFTKYKGRINSSKFWASIKTADERII